MSGRTKKTVINITSALIGQVFAIIFGFVTRIVFVKQLGDTYVGINGLCTSIVGLLSLAELGIGESINYKLYKPLAENNVEKLKSIMNLYRIVYWIIGGVITVIGFSLLPFLRFFLKATETQSVNNLYLIFSLFVLNSASSYFFSYKRALIISDQKRYIVNIIHYTFYCVMNLSQIIILHKTNNFIIYLIVMIISTVAQNIIISYKANKIYPFLKDKKIDPLDKIDVKEIKKNTQALLYHKIGGQVVNSTDNILISKIIGIAIVGIYSNYLLVTSALNTIIAQLFSAITASVGNLGATENENKSEHVLNVLFFGNFCFISIVCAAFYSSIELLLSVMFGKQRILSHDVLICIVLNLYFYNIRRTVWTFRDGYGLFWYDRYKSIVESIINIIFSIILGKRIGLIGILIGTIVSTVSTCLWIEPYILYKYAFKKNPFCYFLALGKYTVSTVFICLLSKLLVMYLQLNGYLGFILGCFISFIIAVCFIFLFFCRTEELKYYKITLIKIFSNLLRNKEKGENELC